MSDDYGFRPRKGFGKDGEPLGNPAGTEVFFGGTSFFRTNKKHGFSHVGGIVVSDRLVPFMILERIYSLQFSLHGESALFLEAYLCTDRLKY